MSVELEFEGLFGFVPPDGRLLATGQISDTLVFWDTATHEARRRFDALGLKSYQPFAFSADGTRLAVGRSADTIALYDTTTGALIETIAPIPHLQVAALALSADGHWLAIGGWNEDARNHPIALWDIPGQRLASQPMLETDAIVSQAAFSHDSQILAFVAQDEAIYQWDLTQEQPTRLLASRTLVSDGPVAFTPDDRQLAAALSPEIAALFDTRPVQAIRRDPAPLDAPLDILAFSTDNFTLLAQDSDGMRRAWDIASGQTVTATETDDERLQAEYVTINTRCVTSERAGCRRFSITLMQTLSSQTIIDGPGELSAWALSRDRQTLAIGTTRNTNALAGISLWNLAKHEARRVTGIVSNTVTALAFSPDGQRLAISSEDAAVIVVDLTADESAPDRVTRGDQKQIARAVTFCDDGQWLIIAGTAELIVWNAATLQAKVQLPFEAGSAPPKLACSPDGKWVAASTESGVTIWNIDFEAWQTRACQIVNRNFTTEEWERFFSGAPYEPTCAALPTTPQQ
jgi:WD40 repeat protein